MSILQLFFLHRLGSSSNHVYVQLFTFLIFCYVLRGHFTKCHIEGGGMAKVSSDIFYAYDFLVFLSKMAPILCMVSWCYLIVSQNFCPLPVECDVAIKTSLKHVIQLKIMKNSNSVVSIKKWQKSAIKIETRERKSKQTI